MKAKLPFPGSSFGFCGLAEEHAALSRSATVILPVPLETGGDTPGASQAPWHIIAASRDAELFDMELGCEIHERGIHTHCALELDHSSSESPFATIQDCVAALLDGGKFPILVGGDRTITLGAVRACKSLHDDLGAVVLSGRTDLNDEWHGRRVSPRTATRRISEICPVLSVGFRSATTECMEHLAKAGSITALDATEVMKGLDGVLAGLRTLGGRVWLSIDLNAFSAACMPIPSNPEPGGLGWAEVVSIVKTVFIQCRVMGCDVVGFAPCPGTAIPEQVASRLIIKLIGYSQHPDRIPRGHQHPSR